MKACIGAVAFGLLAGLVHSEPEIGETLSYAQEGSALVVSSGKAALPAQGFWTVDRSRMEAGDGRVFVDAEPGARRQLRGNRMAEVELEESINKGRSILSSLQWECKGYAEGHADLGPSTLGELNTNSWAVKRAEACPWDDLPEEKRGGPYVHLVPDVKFEFPADKKERTWLSATNQTLLAFELRPYLDDGKHWVVYANDVSRREKIDPARLEEYGVEVKPVYTRKELFPDEPETYSYSFITAAAPVDSVVLPLTNIYTGASLELEWDLADAVPGDKKLWQKFQTLRAAEWSQYWRHSKSPMLAAWISAAGKKEWLRTPRQRRGRGAETSVFGVMGGYAAVRETLQMRVIEPPTNTPERTVPVDSIEGVQVESHPYGEMLGDRDGGRLALAELVPADRFFVHVQQPESLLAMLNQGADFIAQLGSAQSGNGIRYYLKERYLKRLGLTEPFLETILRSGTVAECALTAPDLFFLDGTDVTVLSRLADPVAVKRLLKLVGVSNVKADVSELKLAGGGSVFWALKGDLLWVGTSKGELERSIALAGNGGEGSLGESAEFRYMLTKLPLQEQTRIYAYCSDPFIRRLVGPRTKIAQLRRVDEMVRLNRVTAAAWLARLDGMEDAADLEALIARGYLPDSFPADGISLDADLAARSETYGTLANQTPLLALPVGMVLEDEAKAYKAYVAEYSRFWRQFFDPIAFRVNDAADGGLEAELFILPLIDNSIYNGLRESLVTHGDNLPLKIPEMVPEPVLCFSANLNETAWRGMAQSLKRMLTRFVRVDSAIFDDLGSAVHLMVHDADPVIALGSGDMLGAFGAGFANDEMLFIPAALSVLTRPCTLAVETTNPERVATYLRNATHSSGSDWEISSEFYQEGDAERWVCLFDVMGMVRLRYGLEVKGNYLLIRNIPWSNKDRITSTRTSELNAAALKLRPGAVELQLSGLHSTAAEKSRSAALQGMALLYPLVQNGMDVGEAVSTHLAVFGHTPYIEPGDEWAWENGVMESGRYGSIFRKKQPAHSAGDADFGLLGEVDFIDMSTQFEDDGLRARVRWEMR